MTTITANFYNEYQQQALTTAVFPLERAVDYCALGLASELGELLEKWCDHSYGYDSPEIDSEAGDVWWYMAALCDALSEPFSRAVDMGQEWNNYIDRDLSAGLAKVTGAVKKAIRDDHGIITTGRKAKIMEGISQIAFALRNMAEECGTTDRAVMLRNLDKLAARKAAGTIKGDGDHR